MTKAKYVRATDAFDSWRDDLLIGQPPTFYRIAETGPLHRIEIGPKLITLIGGAPGSGKTAFVMQAVFDALRLNPTLRAVVCNIEMPPGVLLDRQLARLSGVPLSVIRHRQITEFHADRIDAGITALETVAERVCLFVPRSRWETLGRQPTNLHRWQAAAACCWFWITCNESCRLAITATVAVRSTKQ